MIQPEPLSYKVRVAILLAAFLGLVFDGVELGLMPVASLSVSKSLLGEGYNSTLGGDWFARFTAALMLGAAIGGIVLGSLGDRIGRTRATGISILFYSAFAGLGAFVQSQEQMLALRFLVGIGVGGMWPNGIALVNECWPRASRPFVSGVTGAGIAVGILLLSQLARYWPITPDSWRWVFLFSCAPMLLGIFVLLALPESPIWLATRKNSSRTKTPVRALFQPSLLRITLLSIAVSAVPMVGAWAGSKWMMPWADMVAGTTQPEYKAVVQGWWAFGSALGSFFGAQLASVLGRRASYFLISVGAATLTFVMFRFSAPLEESFLPIVFTQGFVSTLFFGWLPLYLPELFPTAVRSAGCGLAYNSGRFVTAFGVLGAGVLFSYFGGNYPDIGAFCALLYALGIIVVWWIPKNVDQTSAAETADSLRSSATASNESVVNLKATTAI